MNIFLKNKIAILIIFLAAVFAGAFMLLPAKQSSAIVPFGGPILNVTYCTCSGNILLTVGPPMGGRYIFQPGASTLFPYGQVYRPGPWVLGTYAPGGVCTVFAGKGCAPLPSFGTIIQVSTSL